METDIVVESVNTSWDSGYAVVKVDGAEQTWPGWCPLKDGGLSYEHRSGIRALFRSPCGRYLIKADRWVDDLQCFREALLWESLPDRDRRYFAPVLDFGVAAREGDGWGGDHVGYVIMPFLDFESAETYFEQDDEYELFYELIVREYKLHDWGCRQFKLLNGSPVIHDYGI